MSYMRSCRFILFHVQINIAYGIRARCKTMKFENFGLVEQWWEDQHVIWL